MAFDTVLKSGWQRLQNFTLVHLVLEPELHLVKNLDSINQLLRKLDLLHPLIQVLSAHQFARLAFVELAEVVRCLGARKSQYSSAQEYC